MINFFLPKIINHQSANHEKVFRLMTQTLITMEYTSQRADRGTRIPIIVYI